MPQPIHRIYKNGLGECVLKTNTYHTKKMNHIKTKAMQKEIGKKMKNSHAGIGMAKGMIVALAITCIFFIGYGILITYGSMTYDALPIVVFLSAAISSLVAGYDFAVYSNQKGIFIGGIAGLLYVLLLCFLIYIAEGKIDFSTTVWKVMMVAILSGGIGGIFGANNRKI